MSEPEAPIDPTLKRRTLIWLVSYLSLMYAGLILMALAIFGVLASSWFGVGFVVLIATTVASWIYRKVALKALPKPDPAHPRVRAMHWGVTALTAAIGLVLLALAALQSQRPGWIAFLIVAFAFLTFAAIRGYRLVRGPRTGAPGGANDSQ